MNCEQVHQWVPLYLDGELDALNSQQIEQHLGECSDCRRFEQEARDLSQAIRSQYPYESVPANLHMQVIATTTGRKISHRWTWTFAFGAGLAAGIALMLLYMRPGVNPNGLQEQLIADHVRSMMGAHLVDVESSDRHTVKPWFQGKLDFSPEVVDLASQGFPLIGGRVEIVEGHSAAALVYRRNRHILNVFVTSPAVKPIPDFDRLGFHSRRFTLNGLNYLVVSDVNTGEIETFERLFVESVKASNHSTR